MRKAFWLLIAVLMVTGCAPVRAQTVQDHKNALKLFIDGRSADQIPAVEAALAPLGYVAPTGPPDPQPGRQTIFTTTLERGPIGIDGLEEFGKYARPDYNTQPAQTILVDNMASAHSGRWFLKCAVTYNGGEPGARVFIQKDWRTGKAVDLPAETWLTQYVKIPQLINCQYFMISGWKQVNSTRNPPPMGTMNVYFQGKSDYLRLSVKGAVAGAATGEVQSNFPTREQEAGKQKLWPINKWVKLVLHVKNTTANDGLIEVFQDDDLILKYTGKTVRTGAPLFECEACACYGRGFSGAVYFDDVTLESPK